MDWFLGLLWDALLGVFLGEFLGDFVGVFFRVNFDLVGVLTVFFGVLLDLVGVLFLVDIIRCNERTRDRVTCTSKTVL